ncbi:hypothetical protein ACHAWX_006922 [Stephanocyclus meneghinianus]
MANCKSYNASEAANSAATLENRKRFTSLSSNLARFASKVNLSRSDELKAHVAKGCSQNSRECHNPTSPHFESPGVMKDEGFDSHRVRSVFSKGDLTAMTGVSSSEESSTSSQSSEVANYTNKCNDIRAMRRPAFRRSLTDEDYNLFLEFLETPSLGTPYQHSHSSVYLPSTERKSATQDTNSSISNSGSLSSQDVNRPCLQRKLSSSEELSFDLLLPMLRGSPREHDLDGDDVSILLADDFDELGMDPAAEDFIAAKGTPLSRGKEGITSSAIAWSALAALLGTHSPTGPFQEKKARVVKNLWVNDVLDDDDIVSLAESQDSFLDDASSIPSLVVESHEVF